MKTEKLCMGGKRDIFILTIRAIAQVLDIANTAIWNVLKKKEHQQSMTEFSYKTL